jgi:hypothetical protein
VQIPIALDEQEKQALPDSPWTLLVRNVRRVTTDDSAGIGVYCLNVISPTPETLHIEAAELLSIDLDVETFDVSVESSA